MGLAQSNLNWNHLTDYVFALRQGEISAVFFRQSALPDPCVLLGTSLVNAATDYAKKSDLGLYVTGYGQCIHCTKPTIYTWSPSQNTPGPGSWITSGSTVPSELSDQLYQFANDHNLDYLYFIKTDAAHNIKEVFSVYHREGKTLHPLPGCNLQKKNSFQVFGKNANIIVIVLIIILIIFLLWVIFSACQKKEKSVQIEREMR